MLVAVLEGGGDFLMRKYFKDSISSSVLRNLCLAGGAIALVGYGVFVNKTGLDFGKAIGVYVLFFFVVCQIFLTLTTTNFLKRVSGGAR